MDKKNNRKRATQNYNESKCQIYEDESILPFKCESWLHLKSLICLNNKDISTLEEILSCLRAIKSRDSEKGRIALDATYELFFAHYVFMTTNHDSIHGKENLTRILGVTVNRVVGHLQDIQVSLENYRGATIRETLKFFKIDVDIADHRNDFAHGNIPSLYVLLEAIEKLTELIIKVYWEFFDGDTSWPKSVFENNLGIIENMRESVSMVRSPDTDLMSYKEFVAQKSVKQLKFTISNNCSLFITLLIKTKNLIIIDEMNREDNIRKNSNFIPTSHHIIAMKYFFKLLLENGDVFELARLTGEYAIETEDEYFKKQYIFWTSWFIKRIAIEKLVSDWEIKELSKICVILDLEECLDKIREHYNVEMSDFISFYETNQNKIDNENEIKEVYVCGPWSC
uniref:DUF4209 domain-containing protein n=1 Tax=Strongyloides venezuelensis TaxID=75913 RepID=A0A0K0F9K8_STRVS